MAHSALRIQLRHGCRVQKLFVVRNLPVELEKSGDKLEEFLEILESEAEKSNDEFRQKEYFGGQSGGFQDFKYPVDGF